MSDLQRSPKSNAYQLHAHPLNPWENYIFLSLLKSGLVTCLDFPRKCEQKWYIILLQGSFKSIHVSNPPFAPAKSTCPDGGSCFRGASVCRSWTSASSQPGMEARNKTFLFKALLLLSCLLPQYYDWCKGQLHKIGRIREIDQICWKLTKNQL